MTTIVNNPPSKDSSSGPITAIIVIVVLLVLGYLGIVYGVPAIQKMQSNGIQVNVPSKIDVNVNESN